MTAGPLAKAGKWYAERMGWRVIPLGYREKVPILKSWPELASNDSAVIEGWAKEWPECNVGIVTGAASGIIALDVDPRHGGDVALEEIERIHGPLPVTVESLTGTKGRHVLFDCPTATIRNSSGRLGPGLDIRGDGGYIVVPPSIHPSGTTYTWTNPPHETMLAPVPVWMAEALAEPASKAATGPEEWRALTTAGVSEGSRNDTVARLAGHLLRRYVDPFVVVGLLTAWNIMRCNPPLCAGEVETIVDSVAARELRRRKGAA